MAAEPENPIINAVEPPAPTAESEVPAAAPTAFAEAHNDSKAPLPKPKGKKRKSKAPRDVTAPRQPLTGYVRYLNERRETLRAANPRLGFAEVTRRLASEWGRLPVPEKQQYLDAAEQDRERYIKEWSLYKETDAYRTFRQQQLERKEAGGGAPPPKRQRPAAITRVKENASTESIPAALANGGGPTPVQHNAVTLGVGVGGGSVLPIAANRPKSVIPAPTVTPPVSSVPPDPTRGGADPSQRETDIPIFTEQFLKHNKLRETELRQMRKANTDYEQQNAILQKHIENMRGAVDRARSDSATQRARTTTLRGHLGAMVDTLVRGLSSVPLPGGLSGASKQNIEQYMESLRSLASENKNHAAVRQARDFLNRMEMPT